LRHSLSKVVPYTTTQLFALVGDVERYPQFVPWVERLRAWNQRDEGQGVTTLDAEAEVRFAIVHERFATKVRRDEAASTITVSLIDGPFRHLENRWSFREAPGGAELTFEIDFEFKTRLLDALLRANFEKAVRRLVACFEDRAKALYG
jgi:coenzyme Q-binding protein COQ10